MQNFSVLGDVVRIESEGVPPVISVRDKSPMFEVESVLMA